MRDACAIAGLPSATVAPLCAAGRRELRRRRPLRRACRAMVRALPPRVLRGGGAAAVAGRRSGEFPTMS
ncbi:hypothetical protein F511_47645 [Dorcoceras hygrometricum]|uniref:Uncharacterized protein n=1 Tax=Dorcoceras hygrometricum TaxID=472368 RepID=A0A2Z6ZXP5_9LAMI|nr:hypothetical protein F511_47645 [Dorcoceras hygrometricum]